jgi:hypothetical protein
MTPIDLSQPLLMCHRDGGGRIDALTRQALTTREAVNGAWEPVATDDPEVVDFLRDTAPSEADGLSQSDTAMARVLEDLIDTLIERGLIQFTDLPAAAQAKLLDRRQKRASLKDPLQLLPFAETSFDLLFGDDIT